MRLKWIAFFALAAAAAASATVRGTSNGDVWLTLHPEIGAEVDGIWLRSDAHPRHADSVTPFQDELGRGQQSVTRFFGLQGKPDLILTLKRYEGQDWQTVRVSVSNTTGRTVRVSKIRIFDAAMPQLGGAQERIRVLSDSYSEDTPVMRIRDFPDSPVGGHLAVGDQLLFSRDSGISFFAGTLTSHRWLTVFRLTAQGYTADAEGTTALTSTKSLDPARTQDHIVLRIPLEPGAELSSDEVFLARSKDYLADLRAYGDAVRTVNHARTLERAPWGWWSYTAHYFGISQNLATTEAQWLSSHLRDAGFDTLHIDEGYDFARGDYLKGDPARFPGGLERFARSVTALGLKPGFWTAPFEVSSRSWVYQNHKDWLVRNERGEPICLGRMKDVDDIYALDPTNPGARDYLHQTYWTMAHVWGAKYIKMDFMEASAVEGVHYRPNVSAIEALREGLQTIREAVGDDVILDKDGSPMLAPVGIVDAGRISNDTEHSFQGTFDAASGIAGRFFMNRNFFVADPDAFCVSNFRSADPVWEELAPVTLEEAKAAIALSAMAGGMFEIGDDLPGLGTEPERRNLVTNPDLLRLVRQGKAATPLDLMSYASEDMQPSLFWVRESERQGILAVFNWTQLPRSHDVSLSSLQWNPSAWSAAEIFGAAGVTVTKEGLHIEQPAHSVRMIKIVDSSSMGTERVEISGQAKGLSGARLAFEAEASGDQRLSTCRWDFGDDTSEMGCTVSHTFTHAGTYAVRLRAEMLDGSARTAQKSVEVTGEINTRFNPGVYTDRAGSPLNP